MALRSLSKVVDKDLKALQRYRNLVLECLKVCWVFVPAPVYFLPCRLILSSSFPIICLFANLRAQDPDISIRRRSLDILCLLVNKQNVQSLVPDLIQFLMVWQAPLHDSGSFSC